MGGRVFSGFWHGAVVAGLLAVVVAVAGLSLVSGAATAQVHSFVGPQSPAAPAPAPGPGSPGATIGAPMPAPSAPPAVPPAARAAPSAPAGQRVLAGAAG